MAGEYVIRGASSVWLEGRTPQLNSRVRKHQSIIPMLSRRRYTAIQLAGLLVGLAIAVVVGFAAHRFVTVEWLKWVVGLVALAIAETVYQLLAGPHTSYRKYIAANGGPDLPPSRFWATSGQAIVLSVAGGCLALVTVLERRPGAEPWAGIVAGLAWVGIPAAALLYLFIARDWRRELASRGMLSNER